MSRMEKATMFVFVVCFLGALAILAFSVVRESDCADECRPYRPRLYLFECFCDVTSERPRGER